MRSTPLLISLMLVATTLLAAAPTAEAISVCTKLKDAQCPAVACYGYDRDRDEWKTCVLPTIYCVTEPCGPYAGPETPELP